MFSRTSTFTSRLAGTITEYRLLSTRRPISVTYTVGALGWATVRPSTDSKSSSLYQETQAFRCLQTLSSPPDGQSPSAAPPTANEFRSHVPTVKGAFGIHGRHWFDSIASHSAPSTRQGGAHNGNKQREPHHGRKQTTVGKMGALRRHRPR